MPKKTPKWNPDAKRYVDPNTKRFVETVKKGKTGKKK